MIFKSVEQLKDYMGGIQKNMNWATWKAFVNEAEEFFIVDQIGPELLEELSELVVEGNMQLSESATDHQKKLINLLRMAVAGYTDFLSAYRMIAPNGDAGKTMPTPPNTQAVTKWTAIGGMEAAITRGDLALEKALVFLENNADEFDTWKSSDNYTVLSKNYVTTATQLTKYFPFARNSRRMFMGFAAEFTKAQGSYLNGIIGKEFNAAMIARLKAEDLSDAEAELVERIAAVVSLRGVLEGLPYLNINDKWRLVSMYDGYGSESILPAEKRDEIALKVSGGLELAKTELINYLQETASTEVFPLYFASSLYESRSATGNSSRFINKKERKYARL